MQRRLSTIYIGFTLVVLVLWGGAAVHAAVRTAAAAPRLRESENLVRRLLLTDLCIFTEARYTRHPAMADLHAPFQEHPAAFEHFPSGSLLLPPAQMTRHYADRH